MVNNPFVVFGVPLIPAVPQQRVAGIVQLGEVRFSLDDIHHVILAQGSPAWQVFTAFHERHKVVIGLDVVADKSLEVCDFFRGSVLLCHD